MRIDRGLRGLGAIAIALSTLAVGCSTASEEGTDDQAGAWKVGGRFSSKLEPGIYDAENVEVEVLNFLDRQGVRVVAKGSDVGAASLLFCEATVDVEGEKAKVEDDDRCSLELVPKGNTVRMTGTIGDQRFSAALERRRDNALEGEYTDGTDRIVISKGTEDGFTFSLFTGDLIVENVEARVHEVGDTWLMGPQGQYFRAKTGRCELDIHVLPKSPEFSVFMVSRGDCPEEMPQHIAPLSKK